MVQQEGEAESHPRGKARTRTSSGSSEACRPRILPRDDLKRAGARGRGGGVQISSLPSNRTLPRSRLDARVKALPRSHLHAHVKTLPESDDAADRLSLRHSNMTTTLLLAHADLPTKRLAQPPHGGASRPLGDR